MQCPACDAENREGAQFCAVCGRSLASVAACPTCGTPHAPRQRFCDVCGQPLGPPPRTAQPHAYTPPHLAEKILTSRSALEGERKQVTVLFADVKGSMDLAEQVDPEEWHGILDRFFTILAEGVHRFEGTVNQYTGDGIMALFGAPIAHEDHAQRACWAALHLRDALGCYADELRRTRGLNFAVRTGLNSGEVVVGKIGDDLRMDYTAQGHTVGLAQRVEQLAAPDRVYLTEHTAVLVTGYFCLRDLGVFTVKGVREPVRVHELEGPGAMRTRLDVSRARGFSRFVGREDEVHALEAALARALAGHGQVVGVVADAGVGKSRLCFEFLERCRARGVRVTEAHAVAHGKLLPFLPVLELLRSAFGIEERDADETARRKIAGTLLLIDRALDEAVPLVFEFLGVADPRQPVPASDPEARQRQLVGVVRRLIQARSEREPGVILLEDLHWMDGGSEVFVASAVETAASTRTLLLVNFRPEYHAAWMGRSWYQQLPLLPLGESAISALLDELLGPELAGEGLGARIRDRTGGNPFFIEEVVQALADQGVLERPAGGQPRLSRPVTDLQIPPTVQAVLAARIDRLPEREKTVLQTAAVIGREFDEAVLAHVLPGIGTPDLAAALRGLVAAEFIYEAAVYPAPAYTFKHPLTQEVAYRSVLTDRRQRDHAAVARTLAARHADKLAEQAPLLAHHWAQAGEALEAARWYARAAERVGVSDRAEAVRHWEQACALLATVPESPETLALGVAARTALLTQRYWVGLLPDAGAALCAEGTALAERSQDVRARALLAILYARNAGTAAVVGADAFVELAVQAAALAEATGARDLCLFALQSLTLAYSHAGRLREGIATAERGLALAEGDLAAGIALTGVSSTLYLRLWRAHVLGAVGRISECARELDQVAALAREHGQREAQVVAEAFAVMNATRTGETQDVLARARRAVDVAERVAHPMALSTALGALGVAHVLTGGWDDARAVLEQQLALLRERSVALVTEGAVLAQLATARLGAGDPAGARAAAEEAVAVARRRRTRLAELFAHLALARVLRALDGVQAAAAIRAALAAALRLVEETGACAAEPVVRVELAALAQLTGDEATRQRELGEAHRLFTAMGATARAEQVAKELSL